MLPYDNKQLQINYTYLDWNLMQQLDNLSSIPNICNFSYHYEFYHYGNIIHWALGLARNILLSNDLKNIIKIILIENVSKNI